MPHDKKGDLEKHAWAWVSNTSPEEIEQIHLEYAYRINSAIKKCKNCKKNCTSNPRCLTGLGEDHYFKSKPAKVDSSENTLLEDLRMPSQYVGLLNLGATCYVNSLIQVWFHNEDMRKIIYQWNIEDDRDEREKLKTVDDTSYQPATALGQLQYIFAMMQFGNQKELDPINLATALGLDLSTQQDAQEFSKLLLNHIEGKFQRNHQLTRMLQKLTQGRYNYINCCNTCGTEHTTEATFYELDLQLAPTLSEAIDKFLSEEKLTDSNQYHCRVCNSKQDARRFIRLQSLPETLNIQLLRFVFQRVSVRKKKLLTSIQFPEELDMSEYLKCPPKSHVYTLVSTLNHKGNSAHSGHFSANIRKNNGEWYEFSDDKVELIQSNRMEDDTIQENGKTPKQKRIPKGYFSSNTAYMLVYKRQNSENSKKGITKRMHNNLHHNNIEINNPSVTLIRSHIEVPQKGKRLLKDSNESQFYVVEKKTKLDHSSHSKELNCSVNNSVASINNFENIQGIDAIDDHNSDVFEGAKNLISLRNNSSNSNLNFENNYLNSTPVKKELAAILKTEKDFAILSGAKNSSEKVDYLSMSSSARDKHEQIEFKNWGLSPKMQYLVKRENDQHEIDLIVAQQGKEKEVEDKNEKRQLVIAFYSKIGATNLKETRYRWIPSEWLSLWLKPSRKVDQDSSKPILPIDCTNLMCPHKNVDPTKVTKAKYVPYEACELLYEKYDKNNELTENNLCLECVQKVCRKLKFKEKLEKDAKEINEILKNFKQLSSEEGYVVGAESFKFWKKKALSNFEKENDNFAINEQIEMDDIVEALDEEEEELNFNEDVLCKHNRLIIQDSKRKIVPREAWDILKEYFPNCKQYRYDEEVCTICQENMEKLKKTKEEDKEKKKTQKECLSELYFDKNRNKVMESLTKDQPCFIVEKEFLENWRYFIRYPEGNNSYRQPPDRIRNSKLLCEHHNCFLHMLPQTNFSTLPKEYTVVNHSEWFMLTSFYNSDHEIKIFKDENGCGYYTEPETCQECMFERLQQEQKEKLKYDNEIIFVKRLEENEVANGTRENCDMNHSTSNRPARRGRKIKGSQELTVSSEQTLKELKLQAMPIFHAGPLDQHIFLGDHELVNDEQTLSELGITPRTLLMVKIDTPIETSDTEFDAVNQDHVSPERGFKGTELAG